MKLKFKGLLVLLVVLMAQLTFAQERTVSGIVKDNANLPIPGASVLIKGTRNGTQTNFDGKYSIKVAPDQTLVISFIGMKTQEVKANATTINVSLANSATELEGVTVTTAMGIKKQKRSLGYATASVGAKDLTDVANVNVFESLSGKVAGVDISTPAQTGAASKVIIRGFNSLSNNSPLYVVDGTPINNSNNGGGTSADGKSTNSTRSFDAGNGVSDLDPNNIESMSILKGAAASALYGSRAANGVILITTKSSKNKSKISVDFLTSSDFTQVSRVPHLQNDFGQGWYNESYSDWGAGANSKNTASNENGSWGARYNGELRPWGAIVNGVQQYKRYEAQPDNIKDFYKTGTTFTNSVRLSGGGENSNFSLNVSGVNSDGVFPTKADAYDRNTLGLNAGITGKKLSVRTSINYISKDQNVVNTGQGSSTEGGTVAQALAQTPRDINIVGLQDYVNNPYNSPSNFYSPYVNNPYWELQENATNIKGNRVFGNVNFGYKLTDKLTANYQIGGDYRNEKIKSYGAIMNFTPGSASADAGKAAVVGGVTEKTAENIEMDTNFNLTYATEINEDFNLNAMVGFNTNQRSGSSLRASVTNLDIPNFYELSNSILPPTVSQDDNLRRSLGVFASIEASYKNRLFATITGRNDWTSTLPKGNNSYFYPSLNVSYVAVDMPDSFLKLRAGIAAIGNDTGYYQTGNSMIPANAALGFGNIMLPIGGVNGYEFSGNLGNPNLKPERTNEFEIGFESNFYQKRVNLDLSVYNKRTNDLLFSRPLAASSGFSSQTDNILDLQNRGIEIVLNLVPVRTADFQWDFTTTFTKNISEVLDIAYGLDKLTLASMYGVNFTAQKGEPLGVFTAFAPKTTADGRPIVVASTGYYDYDKNNQTNVGTSQRDFVMGLKNNLRYKNFTLGASLDWKQGGEMYSYTKRINEFAGNGIETAYNGRNTYIIPNSVVEVKDASGNITYAENTTPMSTTKITSYWNTSSNPAVEAGHIIDKTFVRLRDVVLSYNVPTAFVQKLKLANASISLYGKNLVMWTPDSNPYVDPELSTYGDGLLSEAGEFATNPAQRSYGASFKVTF